MNSSILAIRAITSEYAKRLLWFALAVGLGIYTILLIIIGWVAATVSNWWWLLAAVPSLILSILAILWLIAWVLARRLAPPMNAQKRRAVRTITGHITELAEQVGTPKFVILYRLIKDITLRPASGRTYIGELTSTPGKLQKEFESLRKLF